MFSKLVFLIVFINYALALWDSRRHVKEGQTEPQLSDVQHDPSANGFKWFHQRLDHFDNSKFAKWYQFYYVYDHYYKKGGPVFLYIGGEGAIHQPNFKNSWQFVEWGKKTNALIVGLEHRFYGQSQPFKNMTVESLRYLNIDQALADLAVFRQFIMQQKKLPQDTKWISFGGSYPGALSAWLRAKYPHLIDGAVASSAPILMTLEFSDYMNVVSDDVRRVCGPTGNQVVRRAFKKIEESFNTEYGRKFLKKTFKCCPEVNLTKVYDRYAFLEQIIAPLQSAAQYGQMKVLCDSLLGPGKQDEVSRIASLTYRKGLSFTYYYSCVASYSQVVARLKDINSPYWKTYVGMRQWIYQTCFEVGYFQTTQNSLKQNMGRKFQLTYFLKLCSDVFDREISPESIYNFTDREAKLSHSIYNNNILRGGRMPSLSNVVFVNGLNDPWHKLSVLEKYSPDIEVVNIQNSSHCLDMVSSSDKDPRNLTEARKKIFKFIQKVLGK